MPRWLSRYAGINESVALQINSVLMLVFIPLMVLFVWAGDRLIRHTRRRVAQARCPCAGRKRLVGRPCRRSLHRRGRGQVEAPV